MADAPFRMNFNDLIYKAEGKPQGFGDYYLQNGDPYYGEVFSYSPKSSTGFSTVRGNIAPYGLAALQIGNNVSQSSAPISNPITVAQQSNNDIIARNQGLAQQMINQTAEMPQYAGRVQQFEANPNLQNGAAPVLPAANTDKLASGGIPRLRRNHGFHTPGNHGLVASKTSGRSDKISTKILPNSFVIPADVVSGIGEGNTENGAALLHHMFGKQATPIAGAQPMFANGGAAHGEDVPVMLSGGEYVIHPDSVKRLGNGDISEGHKILHRFVTSSRQKHIQKLRKLKPPKK